MAFQINATINAQTNPAQLKSAVGQVQKAFTQVVAPVDVKVSPAAIRQLAQLQQAAQSLGASLGKFPAQSAQFSGGVASTVRASNQATNNLKNMGVAARAATNDMTRAGTAARSSGTFIRDFGEQAGLAARRFLSFTLAAGSFIRLIQGIKQGIAEAASFEREMIRVAQVSDATARDIKQIDDTISGLATRFGLSSAELARSAVVFKQAGQEINELSESLKTLALASVAPNFNSLQQTAEGIIAVMRQFRLGTDQAREAIGGMNAVAGSFAVEAGDLIDVVRRAGGAFQATGGDVQELISLFTSVRATTRESAESIATGFRTIFTRLQRPQTVDALKDLQINLRYTKEEAEKLGNINLKDQFVGGFEAVRRISEGLAKIRTTDPRFASVIEEIGGFRQVSRVIPLLKQFADAQQALTVARTGDVSLIRSAEKAEDGLLKKTAQLREEFAKFFRDITNNSAFRGFLEVALQLGQAFASILNTLKPIIPLLTGIATVRLFGAVGSFLGGGASRFLRSGPPTKKFATGGLVPGQGRGDTVPAMLEPGEFVLNRETVQAVGQGNLQGLNRGGAVQRLAPGGNVLGTLRTGTSLSTPITIRKGISKPTAARLDKSRIDDILLTLQQRTGLDFSKLAPVINIASSGITAAKKLGFNGAIEGYFSPRSFNNPVDTVGIVKRLLGDRPQLRRVLSHEFGHGVDRFLGKNEGVVGASLLEGSAAQKASKAYSDLLRYVDKNHGGLLTQNKNYFFHPTETFAEGFALYAARISDSQRKLLRHRFNAASQPRNYQENKALTEQENVVIRQFDVLVKQLRSQIPLSEGSPLTLQQFNRGGFVQKFNRGGTVQRLAPGGQALRRLRLNRAIKPSTGRPSSSRVVDDDELDDILLFLQQQSGINFSKLAPNLTFFKDSIEFRRRFTIPGKPGTDLGGFFINKNEPFGKTDRNIVAINQSNSGPGLGGLIGHEFGHAADSFLGGGSSASLLPGSNAAAAARYYSSLLVKSYKRKGIEIPDRRYLLSPEETFAEGFALYLLRNAGGRKLLRHRTLDDGFQFANLNAKDIRAIDRLEPVVVRKFESVFKELRRAIPFDGTNRVGIDRGIPPEVISRRLGGEDTIPSFGLNAGGFVPGRGDTDTVPAMLTPGEFVINKKAAGIIGQSRLRRMNDLGKSSVGGGGFFAGGGLIKPKFFVDGGDVPGEQEILTTEERLKRIHQARLRRLQQRTDKEISEAARLQAHRERLRQASKPLSPEESGSFRFSAFTPPVKPAGRAPLLIPLPNTAQSSVEAKAVGGEARTDVQGQASRQRVGVFSDFSKFLVARGRAQRQKGIVPFSGANPQSLNNLLTNIFGGGAEGQLARLGLSPVVAGQQADAPDELAKTFNLRNAGVVARPGQTVDKLLRSLGFQEEKVTGGKSGREVIARGINDVIQQMKKDFKGLGTITKDTLVSTLFPAKNISTEGRAAPQQVDLQSQRARLEALRKRRTPRIPSESAQRTFERQSLDVLPGSQPLPLVAPPQQFGRQSLPTVAGPQSLPLVAPPVRRPFRDIPSFLGQVPALPPSGLPFEKLKSIAALGTPNPFLNQVDSFGGIIRELEKLPANFRRAVLNNIPALSNPVRGTEAIGFSSPDTNQFLRLAGLNEASARAIQKQLLGTGDFQPFTGRSTNPLFLQPQASIRQGNLLLEKLPLGTPLNQAGLNNQALLEISQRMQLALNKSGFLVNDLDDKRLLSNLIAAPGAKGGIKHPALPGQRVFVGDPGAATIPRNENERRLFAEQNKNILAGTNFIGRQLKQPETTFEGPAQQAAKAIGDLSTRLTQFANTAQRAGATLGVPGFGGRPPIKPPAPPASPPPPPPPDGPFPGATTGFPFIPFRNRNVSAAERIIPQTLRRATSTGVGFQPANLPSGILQLSSSSGPQLILPRPRRAARPAQTIVGSRLPQPLNFLPGIPFNTLPAPKDRPQNIPFPPGAPFRPIDQVRVPRVPFTPANIGTSAAERLIPNAPVLRAAASTGVKFQPANLPPGILQLDTRGGPSIIVPRPRVTSRPDTSTVPSLPLGVPPPVQGQPAFRSTTSPGQVRDLRQPGQQIGASFALPPGAVVVDDQGRPVNIPSNIIAGPQRPNFVPSVAREVTPPFSVNAQGRPFTTVPQQPEGKIERSGALFVSDRGVERTAPLDPSPDRRLVNSLKEVLRRGQPSGTVQSQLRFNDLVEKRATETLNKRLSARGGRQTVSDAEFNRQLEQERATQEAKTRRETFNQERRRLQALNEDARKQGRPTLSAANLSNVARANIDNAAANNLPVILGSDDKVVSTAGTNKQLLQSRLQPDAGPQTRLGKLSAGVRGLGAGAANLFSGLFQESNFASKRAGGFLSNFKGLSFPLLFALPQLQAGLSELGGTTDSAIASGGEGGFTRARGAGGAATGAVFGGFLGSAAGNIVKSVGAEAGGLIGATIGVVTGFINAIEEAEREIRQTKIGNALQEVNNRLRDFVSTGVGEAADPSRLDSLRRSLGESQKLITEDVTDKITDGFLFFRKSFDIRKFEAENQKQLRGQFGNQLPSFIQALNKQAEELAREDTKAKPEDLAQVVLNGNSGLNRDIAQLVASLRNLSLDEVAKDIAKVTEQAQSRARVEQDVRAGRRSILTTEGGFGRFSDAIVGAALSLQSLQDRATSLGQTLDGVVAATPVNTGADNLSQFGRFDGAALGPLNVLRRLGGGGEQVFQTGVAVDAVARVLPEILTRVAARPGDETQVLGSQVRSLLTEQLGKGDEVQRAINVVVSGLNQLGPGKGGIRNVLDSISSDVVGFSRNLLEPASKPLIEQEKSLKALESAANNLSAQLVGLAQRSAQLRDSFARLDEIGTERARVEARLQSERTGRPFQDIFSLGQAQQGLVRGQERLAGVRGANAFNPAFLGGQLRETTGRIETAREAQNRAVGTPAFLAAATELTRLRDRASRLREALQRLTDTSLQNAAIQERLNNIQQDRDSRTSFGERFLTAGPEERARFNESIALANAAANRGNLDAFSPEDNQKILGILREFGSSRLTGFAGSPIASDLRERLIRNSRGGVFNTDAQRQGEEKNLQQQLVDNLKRAEEAQKELITAQKEGIQSLNQVLTQQNNTFLARLQTLFLQNQAARIQGRLGEAVVEQTKLREQDAGRQALARVGITSTTGLEALQGSAGDVQELSNQLAIIKRQREIARRGVPGISGLNFRFDQLNSALITNTVPQEVQLAVRDFLKRQSPGLSDDTRTNILANFVDNFERFLLNLPDDFRLTNTNEQVGVKFNELIRSSLDIAARNQLSSTASGTRLGDATIKADAIRDRLGAISGLSVPQLERELQRDGGSATILNALKAFDSSKNRIEDFGAAVEKSTAAINNLREQLDRIKSGFIEGPPKPPGFAMGGRAFAPRGTDTVPAMLTPGEFVINRESTQANLGLLKRINGARGPVGRFAAGGMVSYLADGGIVPPKITINDISKRLSELTDKGKSGRTPAEEAEHNGLGDLLERFVKKRPGDPSDPFLIEGARIIHGGGPKPEPFVGPPAPKVPVGPPKPDIPVGPPKPEPFVGPPAPRGIGKGGPDIKDFIRDAEGAGKKIREAGPPPPRSTGKDIDDPDLIGSRAKGLPKGGFIVGEVGGGIREDIKDKAFSPDARKGITKILEGIGGKGKGGGPGLDLAKGRGPDVGAGDPDANQQLIAQQQGIIDQFIEQALQRQALINPFGRSAQFLRRRAIQQRIDPIERIRQNPGVPIQRELTPEERAEREKERLRRIRLRFDPFFRVAERRRARERAAAPAPKDPTEVFKDLEEKAGNIRFIDREEKRRADREAARAERERQARLRFDPRFRRAERIKEFRRRGRPGGLPVRGDVAKVNKPFDPQAFANEQAQFVNNGFAQVGLFQSVRRLQRRAFQPEGISDLNERDARRRFDARRPLFNTRRFGFATGGLVPGGGNSDSVPALLTPGEFVLNRGATHRAGVDRLQKFNRGGVVYAAKGQPVLPELGSSESMNISMVEMTKAVNAMNASFGVFGKSVDGLASAFSAFESAAGKLAAGLENFPNSLQLEGTQKVEVVFNGAEVLGKITGDLKEMVEEAVKSNLQKVLKATFPDAPNNLV